VRWYSNYAISYRQLEEMMAERGVVVDHTTIWPWIQRYAPQLEKEVRWYQGCRRMVSATIAAPSAGPNAAFDRPMLQQYVRKKGKMAESPAKGNDEERHGRARFCFATVAGAVFATAIGAFAAAQDKAPAIPDMSRLRPPPGQPMGDADAFGVLDANGDGAIDAAEWRQRKMIVFYILDRDRDLFLVPAEVPGLASSEFAAADLDQDSRLSGYEFNQAAYAQVEFADEDNSRTVTLAEFQSYRARLAGR
jgi:EF hand